MPSFGLCVCVYVVHICTHKHRLTHSHALESHSSCVGQLGQLNMKPSLFLPGTWHCLVGHHSTGGVSSSLVQLNLLSLLGLLLVLPWALRLLMALLGIIFPVRTQRSLGFSAVTSDLLSLPFEVLPVGMCMKFLCGC